MPSFLVFSFLALSSGTLRAQEKEKKSIPPSHAHIEHREAPSSKSIPKKKKGRIQPSLPTQAQGTVAPREFKRDPKSEPKNTYEYHGNSLEVDPD